MIDLLKNYKELHNSSGYIGSVRYQIAKKKLDTHFVKWLFNNQNKVQELLQKAKDNDLQSSKQPPPLFHQRIQVQNSNINPINPNIPFNNTLTTPPRGLLQSVDLNHKISLNETYTPNLGKSTYLTKSISHVQKINMQEIPQFYFPNGKSLQQETQLQYQKKIDQIFKQDYEVVKKLVNEVLQLPVYFSSFLLKKYAKQSSQITKNQFMIAWKQLKSKEIPKRGFILLDYQENKYLKMDNFKELLTQIMNTHPGLQFLKDTPQFQEWYSICVINRMFFIANQKNDFKMTYREFKKSPILNSLFQIQSQSDINLNRSFFCYEDFYVIYIKFWQLDTVHDFLLTKQQLSKYSGYTLSRKTIQRVFSQVAKKFQDPQNMTFGDFVWFIFCVQDKTHPKSIQYWFKILDLDNNGIVTGYELQSFFQEQTQRLAYMQNASSDFNYQNIICQMVDLLKPTNNLQFTLDDFLRNKNQCGTFINFMTDLNKIIAYQQKDAYEERNQRVAHPDWTQWQRFVKPEYKRVQEGQQVINWENDE